MATKNGSGRVKAQALIPKAPGILSLLFMALLVAASSSVATAQVTAAISGRIEDPSGAAVPGATVTVTSLETGASRTVTADEAGNYRVLSLPVGGYAVKAEKTGFKTASQTGINLAVGQQAVVNVKLEVGAVNEQVTVTGEAPVVNTTTASVAGLVGEKAVKELPLNGRSFDQLITLNAGTVNYTSLRAAGSGTPSGNRFTVAGRRPSENYFILNGVELTGPNQDQTIPWGVSGQLLGVDAIREFNVQTDTYGAEYGKRSGAQVSLVTQSGTNQLHGTLFEFLRNSVLDARNFYDPGKIPAFKRNQFGGAAGGPIRRDKTFLFGNYEGLRFRLGQSAVTIVPDANARRGLLPNAQGIPTLVPGLQPAMLPYMAYWPEPNGPVLGGGVALAFASPLESIREEYGTVRLDHTFSNRDSLSGNYTVDDGFHISPLVDPLFADNILLRYQVLSFQETHVFSPSVINVFTAGLSRVGFDYRTLPTGSFPASLSLVPGSPPGLLTVGLGAGGGAGFGTLSPAGPTANAIRTDNKTLLTYQDQVQLIKGSHQISIGLWFQRQRDNGFSPYQGRANFADLPSFLQGNTLSILAAPRATTYQWRQVLGAWYVQDSIQLRPNLNLRLGLRHEFTNGWNDPSGRAPNFYYQNGVIQTNPVVGTTQLAENNSKWLFSPRIGLAWDPFGKGKTSLRAAFGTYYDIQDDLTTMSLGMPPFNSTATFLSAPFLSTIPINPNVALPPVCGPGVPQPCTVYTPRGFLPNFKTPTTEEWDLSVEQQITRDTSLRLSYVGSEGFHNIVVKDPNTIAPQVCSNAAGCVSGGLNAVRGLAPQGKLYVPAGLTRPNPFMANGSFYWFHEGTASYNALQVELKKRFSAGLEFKGNYTWSKNIAQSAIEGLGQGRNTTNIMTPYNLRPNRGLSPLDFMHQASISGGYELPFGHGKPWLGGVTGIADKLASGWQLNWIVSVTSGYPLIPTLGSNRSGNGDLTAPDRPNWNPAFTGTLITGTATQWFNPNAFLIPDSGTWGNVGIGAFRSPGLSQLDLSLFKTTALTERMGLQFRAEFFNILNHTNLGFPNSVVFSGTSINPAAGRITFTSTQSRQIQFGLKLNF
jgi:carboxypeptidase family protein